MASRVFSALKRGFLRPQSSSFMNFRSQVLIFNRTSSCINPPPLIHRLIDVKFMHHGSHREDKEREWERRMDSISAGIAEVHKMNYSPEANAKLEELMRQVENAKAALNQSTKDWKLGYEDLRQKIGKETKAFFDESIDIFELIVRSALAIVLILSTVMMIVLFCKCVVGIFKL
ncbi:hypothetical protein HS088_TW06G00275 [Tripterygium wilfordii]|uniref:Transmembrane protein n=1 Tax=Tripterygium wilfordii TaxID=458696 RepID=A0A7J7DIB1_TRIWF|nr:uncharacterized protein LOC120000975 [Tripterygium wilfordii]KAF5746110.1 hypothetical protein HS088_TW06G00275 [Tripterygium wilfordii]